MDNFNLKKYLTENKLSENKVTDYVDEDFDYLVGDFLMELHDYIYNFIPEGVDDSTVSGFSEEIINLSENIEKDIRTLTNLAIQKAKQLK